MKTVGSLRVKNNGDG